MKGTHVEICIRVMICLTHVSCSLDTGTFVLTKRQTMSGTGQGLTGFDAEVDDILAEFQQLVL